MGRRIMGVCFFVIFGASSIFAYDMGNDGYGFTLMLLSIMSIGSTIERHEDTNFN